MLENCHGSAVTPFDQAESFLQQNLYTEAWEALEQLPSELRASSRALRVRVPCKIAFGNLQRAELLANFLREGEKEDRLAAASAFVILAEHRLLEGREEHARALIKAAMDTRPD